MKIVEVDAKTLNEYVASSSKPHFMQTGAWGEVNRKRGTIPHYLQVKDNDKVIGSALLLEKKILNYSTFYCPRGFICNYDNKEDVKNVIEALKEYVKNHSGLYLKIDPDIIIRKLDKDANPVEVFEDKLALVDYLASLGGKHRGFTMKFSESSAPRFTFRVDVTKDNLLDSFHQTTRNLLKRDNPYGLNIYVGDEKDIDKFYEPMKETAIRKHMYVEDKNFFLDFYKVLHDYGMADLYVVTANINDLKDKYNKMILDAENELKELEGTNKKGRINDLHDQLIKYHKELNQINEINKDEIVLSSMINAKFADKVWTIHGANANDLPFLNANYEMYYQILKDAKAQGFKYVDFYGSEGDLDKKSEAYGIYQFKVRFGGDFDEFIGEFDFVIKPLMNKIITTLLVLRRKIKYRLQQH